MKIHGIIIDIICLINNANTFEDKTKFNAFQREGFNINLLNCEMYSLLIASLLSYLIDYNDLDSIEFIFNKIIAKLYEYKNYKNNLTNKYIKIIYSNNTINKKKNKKNNNINDNNNLI